MARGNAVPDNNMQNHGVHFAESVKYTLGVEIELQILDKTSWDLSPVAPTLFENAPSLLSPRLSPEFIQSILEVQTGICFTVEDVENDLMQIVSMAQELAEDNDCRLFSASLHPFALHNKQRLTSDSRYERIMDELQIVGRRFISQGFHVHVGVADGDTAVKVCNRIQAFLPLLLALSCSSPFSEGVDTGLMSYRTKLFEALPLAGIYSYIDGWQGLEKEIAGLRRAGVIHSLKDLWWDTRPSPEFGTVEIRICDLPLRFNDILAITGVIQALVATIAEDDDDSKPLNYSLLQSNKWQAARHGLDGQFVDPSGCLGSSKIPFREAVKRLLAIVDPMTRRLGSYHYVEGVNRILRSGTGSDALRKKYNTVHNLKSVIESIQGEFWK
ncbi:MAG: carboxylate-amine ligase [Desulforhopalus sp.]|jgi:carboxylate-amine ligase